MKFWASSESFRPATPALVAVERCVEPYLNAAFENSSLATIDGLIRYVPIVMPEDALGNYPERSKLRRKQNIYDCAPQLDYNVFVDGSLEEQLAEYLRGIALSAPHLAGLGASREQVAEFEAILAGAVEKFFAGSVSHFRFVLSLRCRHPNMRAADIVELIGLEPKVAQTVGEPRTTPKGTPLKGFNKATFCVFDLAEGDAHELTDELAKSNSHLRARKPAIDEFREQGGTLEYFLGLFLEGGNRVLVLDPATTAACGELGITLSLDMYPPNEFGG